jgi:hypothetical protein
MATPTEEHSKLYDLMAPVDDPNLDADFPGRNRSRMWSVAPTLTNDAASMTASTIKDRSRRTTKHSFGSFNEKDLDDTEEQMKEDYDARICSKCLANDKDIEAALDTIQIVPPTQEDQSKLVTWDGDDDPAKPMNWSRKKKWGIVVTTGIMTFCVSFASSVFSTTTFVTAELFGVSSEVMILGLSLYVVGFALGASI